jgi:hypothetical protein
MPMRVLNAVEAAAAEDLLESDMRFLMEDVGLRHDVSLVFAHFGFGRMRRFAGIEDTKEQVRGYKPAATWPFPLMLGCIAPSARAGNQLRAENRVNATQSAAIPWEVRGMTKQSNALARRSKPSSFRADTCWARNLKDSSKRAGGGEAL